jgi:hypothetical protein
VSKLLYQEFTGLIGYNDPLYIYDNITTDGTAISLSITLLRPFFFSPRYEELEMFQDYFALSSSSRLLIGANGSLHSVYMEE